MRDLSRGEAWGATNHFPPPGRNELRIYASLAIFADTIPRWLV
jgi:hypothetical protein